MLIEVMKQKRQSKLFCQKSSAGFTYRTVNSRFCSSVKRVEARKYNKVYNISLKKRKKENRAEQTGTICFQLALGTVQD